uniref:ADAM metallopeptidase with thrombospondin type 1 motif 20 n=1 Tax=Mastacembelus armatus TaxID=205130 RepID=A0A7N8WWB8_9TELE
MSSSALCRDAQGGVADESYCAHLPRPPESSACFSPCGQWRAGEWSPCSVTCGVGRTTRQVVCSNYHQPVDQAYCDPDEKPATEQECTATPCPSIYRRQRINDQPYGYPQDPGHHPGHSSWNVPSADNQWRTGPWGSCSSTCAGGFQRRVVVCQDAEGRSNSYCDERVKPAESKSCDSGPCPLWNYGVWGECTQTCGGGRRTRLVVCQRPNGQRLIDYNCDILDKPPDMEQCNLQPCPGSATWHRRPWKPCSVTCGRGTKQREIVCVYQNQTTIDEEHCSHLPRPRTQKTCRAQGCPSWKTNRWRECSVTCGVGVQSRDVYCRLKGTGRVPEDLCDAHQRPAVARPCQTAECTHFLWVAGELKECNATCGEGMRSRNVRCMGPGTTPFPDDYCEPLSRPPSHQPCKGPPCQYIWIMGEWSQCSASCGVGYQQRIVSCSMMGSSQAAHPSAAALSSASTHCAEPHPPGTQPCLLRDCPHTTYWKVGPWSKCSQTCGAGVMERRVECVTSKGQPSKHCRPSERPESQAACQDRECELKACSPHLSLLISNSQWIDGEYYLKVKSRILQVYCAEMQTDFPKEYVTLRSGHTDNYSEVYGYRLLNPFECPYNGSRRQDCNCRNDYPAAGYTVFHKVRLDLSSLRIMITDLQFSQTLLGQPVPYATAGDCYSAAKCPQVSGIFYTVALSALCPIFPLICLRS